MSDETKKSQNQSDRVEDLSQKPISDQDAQSVKGGRAPIKDPNAAKK